MMQLHATCTVLVCCKQAYKVFTVHHEKGLRKTCNGVVIFYFYVNIIITCSQKTYYILLLGLLLLLLCVLQGFKMFVMFVKHTGYNFMFSILCPWR